MTITCACLDTDNYRCDQPATARFTAPLIAPKTPMCDMHLAMMSAWAEPFRTILGRVTVDRVADVD